MPSKKKGKKKGSGGTAGHNHPATSNAKNILFLVPHELTKRFVGRKDILQDMRAALLESRSEGVPVLTLKGISGMGKSEIMLKYCHLHREDYSYVFWLHADGGTAILDAFRGLAQNLGIRFEADNSSKGGSLIHRVHEWLQSKTDWLLLLDNMDSANNVRPYIPATGGHVIVTTRNDIPSSWATVINVDRMNSEEALLLLGLHPPSDDAITDHAKDIIRELDYFPLAINMARSYIESTHISPMDYLKLIKRKPELPLNSRDDANPSKYRKTGTMVWNLSFKKITERNSLATRILATLAFLQPDAIPTSLIQRQHGSLALFSEQATKPLKPVDDILSAIGVLVEFSFVQRITSKDMARSHEGTSDNNSEQSNDILAIHRLGQTVVRGALKSDERLRKLEYVVAALSHELVSQDYVDPQVRKAYEMYLPQVRHIGSQLKDWSQMTAEYQYLLAHLLDQTIGYLKNGDTLQGTEELEELAVPVTKAIHRTEEELLFKRTVEASGPEHPDATSILDNLAALYSQQDETETLGTSEKALGPKHAETIATLINQAENHREQGRNSEAEPLYRRALEMLGKETPDTALALSGLALLFQNQGKYDEAEPLFERALTINFKTLGSQNSGTASAMNDLAEIYRIRSKNDMAEPLYKQALEIYQKSSEPEQPSTGTILNNLAELYRGEGKYDVAETLFRRALVIYEKTLGPEHQFTASSLYNLAELYKSQGKNKEAQLTHQRALAIREKVLGLEHPETSISLKTLAQLYRSQGKHDMAEPLYKRTLAISEKTLGNEDPNTAVSMNNMAMCYYNQEKYDKAEPLLQQALEIFEKKRGPGHRGSGDFRNNLAALYIRQKKYDKARRLYQKALSTLEKAEPKHPDIEKLKRKLTEVYDIQRRAQATRETPVKLPPPPPSGAQNLCNICHKMATKSCSRCMKVWYCTQEHQKVDWSQHKQVCTNR